MEKGWREEGLWDLWGGGNLERENHLECKQRIEKIIKKRKEIALINKKKKKKKRA